MKLRHELSYPDSPEVVLAMVTDPSFWDQVAAATGALSSTATVSTDAGTTTVVVDQEQAVQGVPSFAKKFVGASTRAISTAVWNGLSASYEMDAPGKPTAMSGTLTIEPAAAGSTVVYDLDVKASVPLIGGKLEKLVVELFTAGLAQEQAAGNAWLAGQR